MKKYRSAINYYGGKLRHLNFILPKLPRTNTFVDVFGGGGSVITNISPYPIMVYNDLDQDVVTFFRVLRDSPEELIQKLELTPYSRHEFEQSVDIPNGVDDIEKARLFFIRCMMSIGSQPRVSGGQWSYCITKSQRGISDSVHTFRSKVKSLSILCNIFKTMQIENLSFIDLIPKYDTDNTLFYCDPPYPAESRNSFRTYIKETSIELHQKLANMLNGIEGKAAISGYRCDLYDDLFRGWERYDDKIKNLGGGVSGKGDRKRQECLWVNYDLGVSDLPIFDNSNV